MLKKSGFCFISVISFFISVIPAFAQEQITITTYYPSPVGSYNELQADRLAVGDANGDGRMDAGDLPALSGSVAMGNYTFTPTNGSEPDGTKPILELRAGPRNRVVNDTNILGIYAPYNNSAEATLGLVLSGTGWYELVDLFNMRSPDPDFWGLAFTKYGGSFRPFLLAFVDAATGQRTDVLTALSNGNVGIGTATPAGRLDVNGNVRITLPATGPSPTLNLTSSWFQSELQINNSNTGPAGRRSELTFSQLGLRQWGLINEMGGFRLQDWTTAGGAWMAFALPTGTKRLLLAPLEGNVGIGTPTPGDKLDVSGNIVTGRFRVGRSYGVQNLTIDGCYPDSSGCYGWERYIGLTSSRDGKTARIGLSDASGSLVFRPGGGSTFFYHSDGSTRLADFNENGNLYLKGQVFENWAWSDIRSKKNIKPIAGALEKLLRLRGVTFEYIEPEKQGSPLGIQKGFIAQEVEKVFPEWVITDKDGYKSLSISGFEALAVEAIKELKAENDKLKKRIEMLEAG